MNNDETGRTSRRRVLQGGLTMLAGATVARTVAAQEKLAQNLVQYQETPKDGNKCSACVNFVVPSGCKIVEGKISPEGWCVAYAPNS